MSKGCESVLEASCFARIASAATRILYIGRDTNGMADRKKAGKKALVEMSDDLKEALRQRAEADHCTLSQEITRILTEAIKGRGLPPDSVDQRAPDKSPRRRAGDPPERRRQDDLPLDSVGTSDEDEQLAAKAPGKARRHFGAWDSGDERSADNERIDIDLAREYGGARQS